MKSQTATEWIRNYREKNMKTCGECSVIGTELACSDCNSVLASQAKLVTVEDVEADKREALEKVAWWCPCCEDWHSQGRTCAVYEVWKVREEK